MINEEDALATLRSYSLDEVWGHIEHPEDCEDEGEGFKPSDVPDPDDPESLLLEHGRGIVLMKSIMDDVRYYRNGSCLVLLRKKG